MTVADEIRRRGWRQCSVAAEPLRERPMKDEVLPDVTANDLLIIATQDCDLRSAQSKIRDRLKADGELVEAIFLTVIPDEELPRAQPYSLLVRVAARLGVSPAFFSPVGTRRRCHS